MRTWKPSGMQIVAALGSLALLGVATPSVAFDGGLGSNATSNEEGTEFFFDGSIEDAMEDP
jgi:hypothetical protein